MKRKIELLAPGGDMDSIKAAIIAGADAVYFGLNVFNARYRATNLEFDDLTGIINLAHSHRCEIFITINIIIIESEIKTLINLLNRLVNTKIDGVIVQDLGLFYLLSKHFKTLKIHASTQLTTHNEGQIKFLSRLAATRVNLSRELNLGEIKMLTQVGHENNLLSEVFVHGSNCLSFSGICYFSSVLEGKSGNRGRCSQPCRDQYQTTPTGNSFPLNLKDNSAFNDLRELYDAGVNAVKIEGRMKPFHYVYTVVKSWRNLLNNFYQHDLAKSDDTDFYRVFNRDFTDGFLQGDIHKNMFIDNPRDNSARYFSEIKGSATEAGINKTKQELHDLRTEIITKVRAKITELDIANTPTVSSIDRKLGGGQQHIPPIETPLLPKQADLKIEPTLSILISSRDNLDLCHDTTADIFFQLPNSFHDDYSEWVDLFLENKDITPWFPSVLIDKDYCAAVDILQQLQPKRIVTDNTGIAYEAYKRGIDWVAGPYLNSVNSFTLLCLKEKFNCSGAFISNELNKQQIKRLVTPEGFQLYYSIYHPILLLTSRQCLFYQIEGCGKSSMDEECTLNCERYTSITNLKNETLVIHKSKDRYHRIFNNLNFLNTEIVTDLPEMFSNFCIDLTEVKTATKSALENVSMIQLFEKLLNGKEDAKQQLEKTIQPTTNSQYKKGI